MGNPELHSSEAGFYAMSVPRGKKNIYISQRSLRLFQIHFHFSINFMSDVSHKMK